MFPKTVICATNANIAKQCIFEKVLFLYKCPSFICILTDAWQKILRA